MRKYRRSVWLPLLLFLYTTGMAVYFLPRNTEISDTEKYCTIGLSYVIIGILWFLLRKKERLARKREEDLKKPESNRPED